MDRDGLSTDPRSLLTYEQIAPYYDMLFTWFRDYDREAAFIHDRLQAYGMAASRVLDIGCGRGYHAERLRACGHTVIGLDTSREMLTAPHPMPAPAPLLGVCGDIMRNPLRPGAFDAAYALFSFVLNFHPMRRLSLLLHSISSILAANGILIVESLGRANYMRRYPGGEISPLGSHTWRDLDIHTSVLPVYPGANSLEMHLLHRLTTHGRTTTLETIHNLVLFDLHEVLASACQHGLHLHALYGDFALVPYEDSLSPVWVLVLRKSA